MIRELIQRQSKCYCCYSVSLCFSLPSLSLSISFHFSRVIEKKQFSIHSYCLWLSSTSNVYIKNDLLVDILLVKYDANYGMRGLDMDKKLKKFYEADEL